MFTIYEWIWTLINFDVGILYYFSRCHYIHFRINKRAKWWEEIKDNRLKSFNSDNELFANKYLQHRIR